MKKHIIFLFAAVFVAGMSFYGCNDKNAPDNGGGNGNNGNNDGPKELLSPEDAKEYLANEGKKMMEFRKSLPAFSEKERLLEAIERNQVWFDVCHVSYW